MENTTTIFDKIDFTEEDINNIIKSKLEESINIEFKSAGALSNDKQIKKEISKDVSAFANSDGGIIFYGIDETLHVASGLSYIDGDLYNKEWLENIIISSIQNRIDDLRIIPVRFENDIKKTIYVVKIPKSLNAPHINGDKKYYRRFNFQSIAMEEYEVRNLYLAHKEGKIELYDIVIKPKLPLKDIYTFYLEIQICTKGNYVAEKYKVAVHITGGVGINMYLDTPNNYTVTQRLEEGFKVSTNNMVPVFPDEFYNALAFEITVPFDKYDEVIKRIRGKVYIYNLSEAVVEDLELPESMELIKNKYYN